MGDVSDHRAGRDPHPRQPEVLERIQRTAALVDRLATFCSSGHHHFWSDTVSLRDATLFNLSHISGHRQLTDVYLLGLARKMKGRLATFDRAIPIKAVIGASKDTVAVIAQEG